MSHMQVEFHDVQVRILREKCPPSQFITHNFMGLHNSLNYYDLAKRARFRELGQLSEAQSGNSVRCIAGRRRDARPQEAELPDHGADGRPAGLERLQPQSAAGRASQDLLPAAGPRCGRPDLVSLANVHGRPRAVLARPVGTRRQGQPPLPRSGAGGPRISQARTISGRHDAAAASRHPVRLRQHLGAQVSAGISGREPRGRRSSATTTRCSAPA